MADTSVDEARRRALARGSTILEQGDEDVEED
jgi:hypothetical protein